MAVNKKNSDTPKKMTKNNCVRQASREIIMFIITMLTKNRGMQTDVNEISKKEKFQRKKYMGVFRWESNKMRSIMMRFPVILTKYVRNRKIKITICHFESFVSPRRMNVVKIVWFLIIKFCLDSIRPGKQRIFV
jgi:hypothetical protein